MRALLEDPSTAVGSDPQYPDVSPRDAQALREYGRCDPRPRRPRSDRLRTSRPFTRLGLIAAVIAAVIDQASKLWLLHGFDLANKGIVKLMPSVDLVLTWNPGISYGLFPQESELGQYVLLALKLAAVLALWIWLARADTELTRAGARLDHRGRDRQRRRPRPVWGRDGFRAVPHQDTDLQLQLVCVQPGRCRHRCRGGWTLV